jgi:hypothetical protein
MTNRTEQTLLRLTPGDVAGDAGADDVGEDLFETVGVRKSAASTPGHALHGAGTGEDRKLRIGQNAQHRTEQNTRSNGLAETVAEPEAEPLDLSLVLIGDAGAERRAPRHGARFGVSITK